ncbi:transmembrane protein 154 isoform X2 [Kryptolebias marmoratus]|uniref:transmembrane protein 154 isoform X2 n=1 Tax=Kryptolebias marmoratus TaxID=37003 RepID=UPI0007F8D18A|nr:transmembrane protein 154 isoform X2 [Kryptolebias marmoratus]
MLSQIRKCDAVTTQEEAGSQWQYVFMSLLSNMRGTWLKTPLLLLLLLSSLTGRAFCEDGGDDTDNNDATEGTKSPPDLESAPDPDLDAGDQVLESSSSTISSITAASSTSVSEPPEESTEGSGDEPDAGGDEYDPNLLYIVISAVLAAVVIAAAICGILIKRRCNQSSTKQESSKEDPYLDGPSTEKVPMPMFEEDVPSVLELEMEELDKWMDKDF